MNDAKKPQWKEWVGGIAVLATVFLAFQCYPKGKKPDPSVDFAAIRRQVDELTRGGTVAKHDLSAGESYVNRAHWNALNITERHGLGYILGHYHGDARGTNTYAVTLMDNTTGKRLARWSKAAGYTSYE